MSGGDIRILYVINGFDPGGAEHGLLTLIGNGAFEGCELKVLAFCRGHGELANEIVEKLGDSRVQFVTSGERLTLWACASGFFQIIQISRRFCPQILVLSLKQSNIVGRLAAVFFPGITCVSFEHIAEYRAKRFRSFYRVLLYLLSWRVDAVWADCEETLTRTRRYFLSRRRTEHVIPLFIANGKAPCKTKYEEGPVFHLAAAGRLVARKNVELMIDIVYTLKAQGVAVRLDIYGDGPERATITRKIIELNIQSLVTLHGYRADWLAEIVGADIFINLSEMEGFCIVVAEAMMIGLPVIAVDVGGVRDYGRDGENMIKLLAPDLKMVQTAILHLMQDSDLRRTLGKQARIDILREFSVENMREVMKKALSEKGYSEQG